MRYVMLICGAFLFATCQKDDLTGSSSSGTTTGTTTSTSVGCSNPTTISNVLAKVTAFKALLSSTQLSTVQLDLTKANAIKWSNLPCGSGCRNGLQFSALSTAQVNAALDIITAAMGTIANEGSDEWKQIRAADDVLQATSGGNGYSSGIYFISFLGTPSSTGTWQLQFGGHHTAVNISYKADSVKGATPMFEGVEPKSWTSNGVTYAPLAQEQSTMAAMLASLSTTQLASAKLSSTFSDVLLGPNMDGKFPTTKAGVAVSTLSDAQKLLVLAAIKPWVTDVDDATASCLLSIYQNELSQTYISYSGNATLSNNADYVRIDGPSVWIEFVCQTGVVYPSQIHYHSVWRDHSRDYGGNFTF